MATILLAAKDIGGFNVIYPLAEELKRRNHTVLLIAEGKAAPRFLRKGYEPLFQGTENFIEVSFSLDCKQLLTRHKPDVIVSSIGYPLNLERRVIRAANQLGTPVVSVDDFWGNVRKLKFDDIFAYPNLALTLDTYATRLIHMAFPAVNVEIVGNPGVQNVEISSEVMSRMSNLRKKYDRIVFFAGGGEYTTEEIKLLVQCLQCTSGSWCLIPRFHPKHEKLTMPKTSRTYGWYWRKRLEALGDRVIYYDDAPSGEEVVVCADIVTGGFSTLLTTAAYAGRTTISLQTPQTLDSMQKQNNLREVPLVALGCAHAITEPCNLSDFAPMPEVDLRQLQPYDPQKAAGFVESLL